MIDLKRVFQKEMRDTLRDHRSLVLAFGIPLMGPVMLLFLLGFAADRKRAATDGELHVGVQGASHAPAAMAALAESRLILDAVEGPAAEAIASRKHRVVVVFADGFDGTIAGEKGFGSVQLLFDGSDMKAKVEVARVHRALQSYAEGIVRTRLADRALPETILEPIDIVSRDLSPPAGRSAVLLSMIPMFLLMAGLIGGLHVAADSIAGERERGTLEPLLMTPVPRWALAAGRVAAVWCLSVSGIVVTAILFFIAMLLVRNADLTDLGFQGRPGLGLWGGLPLLFVPFTFFASSVNVWLSARAKTFREAQASTSIAMIALLLFGPALHAVLDPSPLMAWVPGLGETMLSQRLLEGKDLPWTQIATVASVSIVLGAAFLALTTRLLSSERTIA
ncbi:MAG: ABC transporter permease [Myxococcales bacterium]|nr:ABC transporter permease [Myxococcales bacterium]